MNDSQPQKCLALPLLVAAPTVFLSLADSLYHNLHAWIFVGYGFGDRLLPFGSPIILTVLCAIAVWYAIPFGRDGALALAVGYAFALFVLFNFRGPIYWHGLFDLADRNPWPAYAWAPTSVVLGLIAFAFRPSRITSARTTAVFIGLCAVAIAYGWIQALLRDDVYSAYPLTRPMALTVLVGSVAAITVVMCRWYPELFEES